MSLKKQSLLSRDILDAQLSQVDLLSAMYSMEDELIVDSVTRGHVDTLREYVEYPYPDHEDDDHKVNMLPDILSFELRIDVDVDVDIDIDIHTLTISPDDSKVQLSIELPIRYSTSTSTSSGTKNDIDEANTQPQPARVRLRQPRHLNKSQTAQINDSIPPEHEGDLVATIDHLRTAAGLALSSPTTRHPPTSTSTDRGTSSRALVRVWFYFPSLSTRAKRNDLVTYAQSHSLTGFVLAGKPGLLCVEGDPRSIDEYMRTIKTESWGDIPSHQKKVSERYRETIAQGEEGRVFEGMQEITDAEWLGAKRGERGNRSDLGIVEGWLAGKGLGGVFERVLS